MKNKLLVSAITIALTSLYSSSLYATNNSAIVTQTDSFGSVTTKQGETTATSDSSITVMQKDSDATTSILIEQDGATEATAEINQYKGVGSSIVVKQSEGAAGTGNSTKLTQGEDAADGSNTGNSVEIDTQAGTSNKIADYSEFNDGLQTGSALQKGMNNAATIEQHGIGNTLGFSQAGTDNVAVASQDATTQTSVMNISQDGDNNQLTAMQAGATSSSINIVVLGSNNNLGDVTHKVEQQSADSDIAIDIDGDDNLVNAYQGTNADNGQMTLVQAGDLNDADMAQTAVNNEMTLTQNGDSNTAVLTQSGSNDTMTATQSGGGISTLTQY